MNTDKAYILGLIIGGGSISADKKTLSIHLPYKQWGNTAKNPNRGGQISQDIMKVVSPIMMTGYGIKISYQASSSEWLITSENSIDTLVSELENYGIDVFKLRQHECDISILIGDLIDDNLKRRFIAGITDTIGSMTPSHRRFSDDVQIVSFEIRGFSFHFVCQLCNLLYSIGCIPDQVLWQHPNLQASENRFYRSWKKGNKLRVTLDTYSSFGALSFRSKAVAVSENRAKQHKTNIANKCEDRHITLSGQSCKHLDEDFYALPQEIRGGHYLHSKHICAALNCKHAPKCEVTELLKNAEHYISPFTVITKDTAKNIDEIIKKDSILSKRKYISTKLSVLEVLNAIENGATMLNFNNLSTVTGNTLEVVFSNNSESGYPANIVFSGIAYVLASQQGALNGHRPRGPQKEIVERAITSNNLVAVDVYVPDKLTPIYITDGTVSALIGPKNPKIYKKLISFDKDNPFKLYIRDIVEDDLQ